MADKYINEVGVQAIRRWADGKFALDSDLGTLESTVQDLVTEGGEPNVIETVKVNGTVLTPIDKAVDIAVPVDIDDISLSAYLREQFPDLTGMDDLFQVIIADIGGATNIPLVAYKGVITNRNSIIRPSGNEENQWWMYYVSSENIYIIVDYDDGIQEIAGGKIDKIKVNGSEQTITNKEVDLTVPTKVSDLTNDGDGTTGSTFATTSEVESAINQAVASAYVYKGSVATVDDLPSSGNTTGDVYDVQASGMNYAWNGTAWDSLGQYVDTSVLWTSQTGQSNTLEAMTVAEINAILNGTGE